MSYQTVKQYFDQLGLAERVTHLDESSATVLEAAQALNCEPAHIAKTLSFLVNEQPILVVMAGDTKVDNHKFKTEFRQRPRMMPSAQVEAAIGHAPGGVCPFVTKPGVKIFLDVSLKRFATIYPGGGDDHSAVKLSLYELEKYIDVERWVDVCKGWLVNA
ncbi:MAG: YbaK/EbsC family protein [Liquorilactobacillus sp.]|uniref:YbaK/EbsC family protein n=1 Tax=Liquorilactobacillus sp. TaxID=2767923 RepID=UPI0039ECFA96